MKKKLFVLGGITYKNYALNDLINHPSATSLIEYSEIIELNCEQFLDNKIVDWLGQFKLLGLPFRLWDRYADYFKIIGNNRVCNQISEYVVNKIDNQECDIIAHSLGTLIILTREIVVDNLYLLGSPLTSKYWSIRSTANNFLNKKGIKAKYNNLYYCYSNNDIVCSKWFDRIDWHNICCSPCSHKFTDYIDILTRRSLLVL